jgi:hypothetical protein
MNQRRVESAVLGVGPALRLQFKRPGAALAVTVLLCLGFPSVGQMSLVS